MTIEPSQKSSSILQSKQNDTLKEINEAFTKHLKELEKEKKAEQDSEYIHKKSNNEILENMKKLFEDIKSVYKTGMTVEELEALERLQEQIQKQMSQEPMDKKKVQQLLEELEKEIENSQKKVKEEAIKNIGNEKEEDLTKTLSSIESRLEKAQKDMKKIKNSLTEISALTNSYQSAELLQEIQNLKIRRT